MAWQRFLNSLASQGGHLLLLVGGVLLGAVLLHYGLADGHTLIIGSGGALLALLRSHSA